MGRRQDLAGAILRAAGRMLLMAFALAAAVRGAPAQQPAEWDARRLSATRAELTDLLTHLDPDSATALVGIVQRRLNDGDLHAGDGIVLVVDGEPLLSDTFVVDAISQITLPEVGVISLRGVLYSELESHLRQQLSQFLREPVVRARGMVRMLITGAVPRPGFYLVAADALVSETLMAAGGVTADAKLRDARAERAGKPVLVGAQMQAALAQGWTLDRANLRSGDELVVPGGRGRGATYDRVRTIGVLLSIPLTIYSLTKIF